MSGELFFSKFYAMTTAFSGTAVFFVIKVMLGIYAAVLLADVILLLIQRGVGNVFREGFSVGMNIPPELTIRKKKTKVRWEKIKKHLESREEKEFEIAIIEADEMVGDLIKRMGYQGENLGEILKNVPETQIENIVQVKKAHETKNRIIHDERFSVSLELAKETLGYYEKFLDEFEVFD
ncbi:MAG: hypothetical protein COX31_00805 [Candidatus Moranbacteria bacterium CG23_combo_of_CG06-09_8_20_14_all_40_16]|nr:MAG: hypothetical protein COX31_00805 [Candidatus Moranbacteria bacterium CG23_combo_of_CG06-09_8_20_14_all_40_16]